MSKSPQKVGKEFEGKLQVEMSARMQKSRAYCHRLYDTKSAGNYLPSQPGDFIYLVRGTAMLLEIKSSAKYPTLAGKRTPVTDLFDNEQIAKMRLWARAGGATVVVFMDQATNTIEVWDGKDVVQVYVGERSDKLHEDFIIFRALEDSYSSNVEHTVDFLTNYWASMWNDKL